MTHENLDPCKSISNSANNHSLFITTAKVCQMNYLILFHLISSQIEWKPLLLRAKNIFTSNDRLLDRPFNGVGDIMIIKLYPRSLYTIGSYEYQAFPRLVS